ncbi:MAG: hypothetical protein MSC30_05795 [Gaiellaceae bacterium MAG52_C11]|nr:hypothetical protein [Candidatus Gaiellasilicea maunaloa]
MRFSLSRNDRRIRDLVIALDRDDVSMAETWRVVGEAAWKLGLRRPGYHVVRDLARAERARRAARRHVRQAAADVVLSLGSPYVVGTRRALDGLELARAKERFVLEQHKRSSADDP